MRIKDDETRAKVMRNSTRLSKEEAWKKTFVAPDMTWAQREEERKVETRLKEEAKQKSDAAKDNEETVQYIVVGKRGSRRIIEIPVQE